MLFQFNEDEKLNKDLRKVKNLRDALIDSRKRLHMKTLGKCEKVLQKWLDPKPPQVRWLDNHYNFLHVC